MTTWGDEMSCRQTYNEFSFINSNQVDLFVEKPFHMWATANLLGHDYRLGAVKGRTKASLVPSFGDPLTLYCSLFPSCIKAFACAVVITSLTSQA
jgi:hypothetical protein